MDGKKRNIQYKINTLLSQFPIVVILGTRQCGKSTIAKIVGPDWKYFDLENYQDYDRIHEDPILFFKENSSNVIIDEAQKSPKLFETLRGIVDKDRQKKGRFILTGSASFELIKNVSESLAGRVATLELSPFKVNEFEESPLSNFFQIFNKKIDLADLTSLKTLPIRFNHNVLKHYFLKGGYPEPVLSRNNEFHANWMQNYFEQYINRDIRSLFPGLDIVKYRRVLAMLSSVSGTIINKAEIARSVEISEKTVSEYIDIIAGTYFWRNLLPFQTTKIKTTQKLPKGHFVDSGLALFLQNIFTMDQLDKMPAIGRYFETFIVEEVIRGVQATKAVNVQFYHLRTKAGGEIDLVLEGSFGLLPIEIKYGSSTSKSKLKFLQSFIDLHNLPFGIVINNSDRIELISENIIQIPAGAL
ncbi:MAG: ATP-binding protein [Bacteriovorax sp.]|nr:ATP-binding protein [Bacteriovorax sp.]